MSVMVCGYKQEVWVKVICNYGAKSDDTLL